MRQIIGDQSLDYEPFGGYEIFTSADKLLSDECYEKLNYFNSELHRITGKKNVYGDASTKIKEFGFSNIDRMLINNGEGQIDTGKMMKALLEKCRNVGIEILNGVDVTKIENENKFCRIDFNNGFSILSKKVLIAVNGFAQKFLPDYDIQPARAQVLITSPIQDLKFKGSFHYDCGYYYFRNVGNRILFGGGRNLDFAKEKTSEFGLTEIVQDSLDKLLKDVILPGTDYKIENRWSGIMGLGDTKSPIVKKVAGNVYCAVRMGGMGVALGSLTGEEAATLVLND